MKKIKNNKIFNFFLNVALSLAATVPLLAAFCKNIPFSYEVNDDAVIAQILDGSYTGTPDAHAIFVRYPLSYVIKRLYADVPSFPYGVQGEAGVNWYVTVIALLVGFSLAAVLFRLLNYFRGNRLLLCFFYDVAFLFLWMPCFFRLTFSTAAAFLGCMCLLFFGFCGKAELWRPWNLCIVSVLGIASYCLRRQCFYMVLPFLVLALLFKYRTDFFRSLKPWVVLTVCSILGAGVLFLNASMYGSAAWKRYLTYNHARAAMQDYTGLPDYEKNAKFYQKIGIDAAGQRAIGSYTYCLYDDFSPEMVEKLYRYQKAKEEKLTMRQKIEDAKKQVGDYFFEKSQAPEALKFAGFYVWLLALPLFFVTLLFYFRAGLSRWLSLLLYGIASAGLLYMEWVYLVMNGRFPQRVEESVRLLTLTVGVLFVCHLLKLWEKNTWIRLPVLLQIVLLALALRLGGTAQIGAQVATLKGTQTVQASSCKEKAEVAAYCGAHPRNYYIFETRSFTKVSGVTDDLHQLNWFMSGSWVAYSPLYEEKLANNDIENLGEDFLLRDNVYVITKGKKNVLNFLGTENTEHLGYEAVDELEVSGNLFFVVYRIFRK